MTEAEVIQEIFNTFQLNLSQKGFGSFGDDAVVIPVPGAQDHLVLSTDSFCDGTHFNSEIEWLSVGWKALVGSLSDIVAMGAGPSFFMLNLILPEKFSNHKELLQGLYKAAKHYNVSLLGGDVARGESLVLSITVGGYQPHSQLVKNTGARVGEKIFTDSSLGYSLLGFEQHKLGVREGEFVNKFLYPKTPVELGLWLAQNQGVTSLRDVSDGLIGELRQFTRSNEFSVNIFKPKLDENFQKTCEELNLKAEEIFFKSGEDYTLMWTVNQSQEPEFIKNYLEKFGSPPIELGEVKEFNNNDVDGKKMDGKKMDGKKTQNKTVGNKTVGNKTVGNKTVDNKQTHNKEVCNKQTHNKKINYEPNQSFMDSIIPFEHFSS